MSEGTKTMWLCYGQFHCDEHAKGIPIYWAPADAVCAECSDDAPKSYLNVQAAHG